MVHLTTIRICRNALSGCHQNTTNHSVPTNHKLIIGASLNEPTVIFTTRKLNFKQLLFIPYIRKFLGNSAVGDVLIFEPEPDNASDYAVAVKEKKRLLAIILLRKMIYHIVPVTCARA